MPVTSPLVLDTEIKFVSLLAEVAVVVTFAAIDTDACAPALAVN